MEHICFLGVLPWDRTADSASRAPGMDQTHTRPSRAEAIKYVTEISSLPQPQTSDHRIPRNISQVFILEESD